MPTWAENKRVREEVDKWASDELTPRARGLEGRGYSAAEEREIHRSAGMDNPPERKRRDEDKY